MNFELLNKEVLVSAL